MLTQKAKYAIKAMIHLAARQDDKPVLIEVLAKRERLPRKFLERILLDLKTHGLLESRKGRGGGYRLGREPHKISIGEIVRRMDGPLAPVPCVSKMAYRKCSDCRDEVSCCVKPIMKEVRDAIAHVLDGTTLADAVHRSGKTAGRNIEVLNFQI
jgi:Rrf2 family protein